MELTKKKQSENQSTQIFGTKKEKVEMGIAAEGYAFIVERLTKLYANPLAAAIRESMSNAFDSTVRSKSGLPINVELTDEYIAIEDNGEGMDFDTLRHVFTQYGNSTKADDLNQTGAYGLGAKAPLAYGNVFYVESIKDGEEIHLELRVEEGINKAEVTLHEKTDKINGTKIIIPNNEETKADFTMLCKEHLSSYMKYKHEVDIVVNGEQCKPKHKEIIEKLTIFDDIDLTFRIIEPENGFSLQEKKDLIESVLFHKSFCYLISGWKYAPHYADTKVLVDLPAGLLEFSSSRDEITENSRFSKVSTEVSTKIALHLMELWNIKVDLTFFNSLNKQLSQIDGTKDEFFANVYLNETPLSELIFSKNETKVVGGINRSYGQFVINYINEYTNRYEEVMRSICQYSDTLNNGIKKVLANDLTNLNKVELARIVTNEDVLFLISTDKELTSKAIGKSSVLPNADNVLIIVTNYKDEAELREDLSYLDDFNFKYTVMEDTELASKKKVTKNLSEYGKISCMKKVGYNLFAERNYLTEVKNEDMATLIDEMDNNHKNVLFIHENYMGKYYINLYYDNEIKINDTINLVKINASRLTSKNLLGVIDCFDEVYISNESFDVFGKKVTSMLEDLEYKTFTVPNDEELIQSFKGSHFAKHLLGETTASILEKYNKDFSNGVEYEFKPEYKPLETKIHGEDKLIPFLEESLTEKSEQKALKLSQVELGQSRQRSYDEDFTLARICSMIDKENLNSGILGNALRPVMKKFIETGIVVPK